MKALKKIGFFKYGKIVPNLVIAGSQVNYPVLNERAVRAGAGIMFALASFAFFHALYLEDFLYLKIVVAVFLFDFLMKTVVGIKFSPVSFIANKIVKGQKPEFIPAAPKRFAWGIGLVLATTMFFLLYVFNVRGAINLSVCTLCLIFTFFESAFGICIGCKIYLALVRVGVIKESTKGED